MSKKKILFLTSTRADFSKLKSLILKLQSSKIFDVRVFVTGMHLLKTYGSTIKEIRKSKIKKLYKFKNQNEKNFFMSESFSLTIKGLNAFIKKNVINLMVIHGDRMEALAGAVVGVFNNIRVAHIEGGEVSGTIDESIRHSISKLSHIHFVSNQASKKRLIQMGENKKTIFVIGSPDLDIMKKKNLPKIHHAKKYYDINYDKYCIIILHPVTTNKLENYRNQMIIKKLVLQNKNYNFICINPNNDPGSDQILKIYHSLKKNKNFRTFPSMRFEFFLSFLKHSICIIGNSSTGVRESPFYGTNSINIGSRQNNRVKFNKFIYNVNSYEHTIKVLKKIEKLKRKKISEKEFGNGKSSMLMKKILMKKGFWDINIQKTFTDLSRL